MTLSTGAYVIYVTCPIVSLTIGLRKMRTARLKEIRQGITDAKLTMKFKSRGMNRLWQHMFKLRDQKNQTSLYVKAWDRTYKRP